MPAVDPTNVVRGRYVGDRHPEGHHAYSSEIGQPLYRKRQVMIEPVLAHIRFNRNSTASNEGAALRRTPSGGQSRPPNLLKFRSTSEGTAGQSPIRLVFVELNYG